MQQNILQKLYKGKRITNKQCSEIFQHIIQGKLTTIQITAILISMKIRGESSNEIYGAVNTLLDNAKTFPRPNYLFADITGTGGDNSNSINISTISAIVASACGVKIAKHGNNRISGNTGSTDLLKALSIKFNLPPKISRNNLDQLGICFLHAPMYHKVFHDISSIRKELKTRTLFNLIGPLINPAKPPIILIGVYTPKLITLFANILKKLGYYRAAVVHCGGMDEIALHAPIQVAELNKGSIYTYTLTATDFGLTNYSMNALCIDDMNENHIYMKKLLKGQGNDAHKSTIAANVAVILKLFGNENLKKNTDLALDIMHNGAPYKLITQLKKIQYNNE